MATEIPAPRTDFYQSPSTLTVSIYIKGYGQSPVREAVQIDYYTNRVDVTLPPLGDDGEKKFSLGPLAGSLVPGECSERVLGSKIELSLQKDEPLTWPALLASPGSKPLTSSAAPQLSSSTTTSAPKAAASSAAASSSTAAQQTSAQPNPQSPPQSQSQPQSQPRTKKNWDKLVDDLDDDKAEEEAGGDAALQKLFAGIYANADPNTRRAMIKSFTESGGTTLSTDWSSVGQGTVPVRLPEGMEQKKY